MPISLSLSSNIAQPLSKKKVACINPINYPFSLNHSPSTMSLLRALHLWPLSLGDLLPSSLPGGTIDRVKWQNLGVLCSVMTLIFIPCIDYSRSLSCNGDPTTTGQPTDKRCVALITVTRVDGGIVCETFTSFTLIFPSVMDHYLTMIHSLR